jgi:ABC-type dipeptide/oligopeptide/nickel transport system permease component
MIHFVLVRLFQALLTLLAASFLVFALARVTGSPADTMLPMDATPAEREAMIERLGLDLPIMQQYWRYLQDVVKGDFGVSLRTKRPVSELVGDRLFNSLKLASAAMAFTMIVSLPLGVIAAVYRGRFWDRFSMTIALLGQSLPSFWTGIVFILVFSVMLGWLPTSGMGGWQHYVLPAVAMGWFTSAGVVRLLRSSTLEVLDTEYIKLARLKGLREIIVVGKHAVRNALIPVITFVGFMYGIIIAAAITTEVVFTWPGLGRLAYEAVLWRDFPLLQLTVLTWAALIILINFLVDLVYVVLDPRIRL